MASQPEPNAPPFKDYCLILQVHPEADAGMIDAAYWHLARRYSDARRSDPSAKAKLDDLNEAYGVLRSPAHREEYCKVRDAVLGVGALPWPPPPEPEPAPLAVMDRQLLKSRAAPTPQRAKRLHLNVGQVSVPQWQNALAALVILMLASAALTAWVHPALVVSLLAIGVALTTVPLVRKLPHLPSVPPLTSARLIIRRPRLPERQPGGPSLDPAALRQSTEAMVDRMREAGDTEDVSAATSSQSGPLEGPSNTPSEGEDLA